MQVLLAISHSPTISKQKKHKNFAHIILQTFELILPLKLEKIEQKKPAILCIVFISFIVSIHVKDIHVIKMLKK